jgi:hypothetical protein
MTGSTETLYIYNNAFSGTLPSEIGNLRLQHFLAYSNRFDGPIIEELFESIEMTMLRLDGNNFSGKLSDKIGDLSGLRDLRLGGNDLSGSVPASLFRLSQLGAYYELREINREILENSFLQCFDLQKFWH